ncbi:MAG: M24 family metallopeptidase [Proteobacteria bacterium]|nr:M24 family metallopeptidase [Pseudomonadota bacterium]
MLTKLKSFLKDQNLDYFFLPNSDEFFSEYLPESEKRVQAITGFTGSNATVIFGQEKSYFFTDGRYTLQAKKQLNLNEFEIFNIAEKQPLAWLPKGSRVAFDPKLVNVNFVKTCFDRLSMTPRTPVTLSRSPELVEGLSKGDNASNITLLDHNPVDEIWKNRPQKKDSEIFSLNKNLTGLDSTTKRAQILQGFTGDAILISKPENICWLLNIRAADVAHTPLLLAYAILFKNGEVDLFTNEQKNLELEKVNFVAPDCLDLRLSVLRKKISKIQLDESTTNYWLYDLLRKNDFELTHKIDAIELAKSQKNSAEIFGAIKSHEIDGLAVTKFLFWLTQQNETDEISAAKKLLELRQENKNFLYESFSAISGFASNGAVIHYHSTPETNKIFSPVSLEKGGGTRSLTEDFSDTNSELALPKSPSDADASPPSFSKRALYLIDSGGQYLGADFCGTTDVTRTVAIGTPTEEMRENFTRVLKGHLALARAKFPRGTSGAQLDVLAREHLWRAGLDYEHGTGHGVGSFLSVHEGPCGISKRAHQPLLSGMILSNEPGFYKENEYGIRIENLMLVEEAENNFLQFRTLTLAPLDPALIDFRMLTRPEKKWLFAYHQKIYQNFAEKLSEENQNWLKKICEKFEFSTRVENLN